MICVSTIKKKMLKMLNQNISSYLGTKEDNYAGSIPMSMILIPLERFCPESDPLSQEINTHLMKIAADNRVQLLDYLKQIEKLVESQVALANNIVKRLLLDFRKEVEQFTLQYEKLLQQTIKESRNPQISTDEKDIKTLITLYENSDFHVELFLFDYLREREREINAIYTIYYETINKHEPQVTAAGLIPSALMTKRVVFVVILKMLPAFQEEKYNQYIKDKKNGIYFEKRKKKWYNDKTLVGSIETLWRAYKVFFDSNSQKVGFLG